MSADERLALAAAAARTSVRVMAKTWSVFLMDGRTFPITAHTLMEAACFAHYENDRKWKGEIIEIYVTNLIPIAG